MEAKVYDLIIIGGGPGGLSAGIYARRARLETLLLEKLAPGGQVVLTDIVENYPGFEEPVKGFALMQGFEKQARKFGLEIVNKQVQNISKPDNHFLIKSGENEYQAKAVIMASGSSFKKLDVPGEKLYTGRGVSYCATCDGMFYRNQDVAVIGGGDTALDEALYLSKIVSKVYIIHRRDEFRGTEILREEVLSKDNIEVVYDNVVQEIGGNDRGVTKVLIENVKNKSTKELAVTGVFIFVGNVPNSEPVKGLAALNDNGAIIVDKYMKTNIPGLFAAGDVTDTNLRQISTAVGDSVKAFQSAYDYIKTMRD